ncbi:xanthine dehydrogenase family protein molybdopterin-binding subunit [soil metagenome]
MKYIGKERSRVDGHLKVTGRAKYTAEIPLNNLAYGVFAVSTIPSGEIKNIDTSEAEKVKGVVKILTHLNTPKLQSVTSPPAGQSFIPMQNEQIHYEGQPIALVVAETLEAATYAADLIKAEYKKESFTVDFREKLDKGYSAESFAESDSKIGKGDFSPLAAESSIRRTNSKRGENEFPVIVKANTDASDKNTIYLKRTYQTAIRHHNPMENSAAVAEWQGDKLTLYDSTQGISNTKQAAAQMLGLPPENVRVISKFLGGGFGCKGYFWMHEILAAVAAREVKRPVKISLPRKHGFTFHGYQPSSEQILTIAASREGKLQALRHESITPTSVFDDYLEYAAIATRAMYASPAIETTHRIVAVNLNNPTPMRAPHEGLSMFGLESAMDELAYKLEIDPLELRLKNYAEKDPTSGKPFSSKALRECYAEGAERFGWKNREPKIRSMTDGDDLIGWGMASAMMGTFRFASTARVTLEKNGDILIESGTQEIGTGVYTIMPQIAAEVLEVPVERVRIVLGDTTLPEAVMTAGSTSTMSTGSAIHIAAVNLKRKIEKLAGKAVKAENYARILSDNKLEKLSAEGEWSPGEDASPMGEPPDYSMHTFGAIFAEVRVDKDLLTPRVSRIVGVYSAGRIINPKTARSQMLGGMVWGLGQALTEHTILEKNFGCFLGKDLANYEVPVNADIPVLEAYFAREVDEHASVFGAKGIGELGAVGVAPAIANAVYHATGKRISDLPIMLEKLLEGENLRNE